MAEAKNNTNTATTVEETTSKTETTAKTEPTNKNETTTSTKKTGKIVAKVGTVIYIVDNNKYGYVRSAKDYADKKVGSQVEF